MSELNTLVERYEDLKSRGLSLDLTRGKPSSEQVALADELDGILRGNYETDDGTDTRNYGGLHGITEARQIGSCLLGIPEDRVIAAGNSSLQLMYFVVDQIINRGLVGPALKHKEEISAICPVPGYDRHFTLTDSFGIGMVTVDMLEWGPDMDAVEKLVQEDEATSLIWCVPKHSNPTGCTYSDETVDRLAALPALRRNNSASPFYVLWDNAYAVHDFGQSTAALASLDERAHAHGTEDRIIQFASTSKITQAGAGVAFLGGSKGVLDDFESLLFVMTVGFDKVNQLRHARFLRDMDGLRDHMKKHAEILRPKFEAVQEGLTKELGNRSDVRWTQPSGGYFVSLDVRPGTASRVVELAKQAGLSLTPAGATYPYGHDPNDSNIRIAPSFATLEEVESATEILGVCVRLAAERNE